MKTTIERITPTVAAEILKGNDRNRNLSKSTIAQYAKYMVDGEWRQNGETIKISNGGALLDGQHRLHAIIVSGLAQNFVVIRGLDEQEAMKTIDIGKKRTIADSLGLYGHKCGNNAVLAAATKHLMNCGPDGYVTQKRYAISPTAVLDFLEKNLGIVESVDDIAKHRRQVGSMVSLSIASAAHYLCNLENPEKARLFFRGFAEGIGLGDRSPVLALRARFVIETADGKRSADNKRRHFAYFLSAWNAFLSGKSLQRVQYMPLKPVVFKGAEKLNR